MVVETKAQIKSTVARGSPNVANDLGIFLPNILNSIVDSYIDVFTKDIFSVTDSRFGASTASPDNSPAFAAAVAAAVAQGGGIVYVPAGTFSLRTGITLPSYVRLVGAGQSATSLNDGNANTNPVVTMAGNQCSLEQLTVIGCGQPGTNAPFPTQPAVVTSPGFDAPVISHCTIVGGLTCLLVKTQDLVLDNCFLRYSYSGAIVEIGHQGQVWANRTSFDQLYPVSAPAGNTSINAWAANTTYTVGTCVTVINGVLLQCTAVTGDAKSGTVQPSPSNTYVTNISDNHVTWQVVNYSPTYCAVLISSDFTNENSFHQCDFSGCFYDCIQINCTALSITSIGEKCVMGGINTCVHMIASGSTSSQVTISGGTELTSGWQASNGFSVYMTSTWTGGLQVSNCWFNTQTLQRGATLSSTSYVGAVFTGNTFRGGQYGIVCDAGVGNFIISNNIFNSQLSNTVLVSTGASDHYNITNNLLGNIAISDGGSGANKTVSGNNL